MRGPPDSPSTSIAAPARRHVHHGGRPAQDADAPQSAEDPRGRRPETELIFLSIFSPVRACGIPRPLDSQRSRETKEKTRRTRTTPPRLARHVGRVDAARPGGQPIRTKKMRRSGRQAGQTSRFTSGNGLRISGTEECEIPCAPPRTGVFRNGGGRRGLVHCPCRLFVCAGAAQRRAGRALLGTRGHLNGMPSYERTHCCITCSALLASQL